MNASEIITAAFREGNLIPLARAPTTAEQTEALSRLNAYVRALMGDVLGSRLYDWPVPSGQRATSDFHTTGHAPFPASAQGVGQRNPGTPLDTDQWPYPPSNSRLLVRITQDTTIYFPEQPQGGARMRMVDVGSGVFTLTLHGNGRLIEGAATQAFLAPLTARDWFYRDDTADWVQFADMALTDPSALPAEFDEFLVAALTVRLSPTFGLEPRQATVEAFTRGRQKLKAYFEQTGYAPGNAADTPRSAQTYGGREF